jgi:hypothetical protein
MAKCDQFGSPVGFGKPTTTPDREFKMQTNGKQGGFVKTCAFALLGLMIVSAPLAQLNAADQPKPGPEHKKLEVWVGEWTYEGSGQATPFLPASGDFRGILTGRMVLGGFFLELHARDISDDGYLYDQKILRTYDPLKKVYVDYVFMNDGTAEMNTVTVDGNTWTMNGTARDSEGKNYRTRAVEVVSQDGRTLTGTFQYSSDDGKTWVKAWTDTAKKVSK